MGASVESITDQYLDETPIEYRYMFSRRVIATTITELMKKKGLYKKRKKKW